MAGIKNIGTYIPQLRVSRELLNKSWGAPGGRGERALANHDEDSITMAVEAAMRCMNGTPGADFDGLYFATTTAPYVEKLNAALIATVVDMPEDDVTTADFTGSLRCGTAALKAALDAVGAGTAKNLITVAADTRMADTGSALEGALGDAAAALWISNEDLIATIDAVFSLSLEFTDIWRRGQDRFLQTEDAKFISSMGYDKHLKRAFQGLLAKTGLKPSDIAHVALYAPDSGAFRGQTKSLGANPEAFPADSLLDSVGNTGSVAAFLSLAQALDAAQPGERIVLLGFGNGADAFLLTATDAIARARDNGGIAAQVAKKRMLETYGKYLKFRGLVQTEKLAPFAPVPLTQREQKANLRLYAKKCSQCGTISFPVRRICANCSAKDDNIDVPLSRTGTVYTFTKDHLVPTPDPPVIMASADLDGGGRFYGQVTDCDPKEVSIGMRVELCFRSLHEGGEHHNYFWKFRPL